MTCEEAVDLIVDSVMDSVSEELQERLAAHVNVCESCAAEASAIGWTWAALDRLPASVAHPPAGFMERLAAEPTRRTALPWLRAAAGLALLFASGIGGYLLRGESSYPTAAAGSTFLFLVRGDEPETRAPVETLVREYGAWASELADAGRLMRGEKLTDEPGRWVSETGTERRTASDVSGFFVIAAADYVEAVEIARNSPHVRYGGTFEIRMIDPLN